MGKSPKIQEAPVTPTLSDSESLAERKAYLQRTSSLLKDTLFAGSKPQEPVATSKKTLLGAYQ